MNCPKCGGEMWDNRPKKRDGTFSAKSPDFKCKDKGNCDGVIWPDKNANPDYPVSEAAAPSSPWSPEEAKAKADTRSARIERQHSQEMAIRTAVLIMEYVQKPDTRDDIERLIMELTDDYQADLENAS